MLGFMCWVEGTGKPRVIHPTLEGCEKEAKRLISVTTGKKVLVLGVMEVLMPTQEVSINACTSSWGKGCPHF
jgi:hypothetical protein